MLHQREDRVFLSWSLIWLAWTCVFILLASFGMIMTSLILGVLGFVALWLAFCRSLDNLK